MVRRTFLLACALALTTVGMVAMGGSTPSQRIDVRTPAVHAIVRSADGGPSGWHTTGRAAWLAGLTVTGAALLLLLLTGTEADGGRRPWWAGASSQRGPPGAQFA